MSEPTRITRHDLPGPWARDTGERHPFRLRKLRAHVLEVPDSHFPAGGVVFVPHLAPPVDGEISFGLDALGTCHRYAREHPERKVLILGHGGAAGDEAGNVPHSEKRAEGVRLLLHGRRDEWIRFAVGNHRVADLQQVLAWVDRLWDHGCDPGPIDGVMGARTRRAVESFQRAYSLAADGIAGKQTWGAIYDLFMDALAEGLSIGRPALSELRAALRYFDEGPKTAGCAGHWPIETALRAEYRSRRGRRVEILFFDRHDRPEMECHPASGQCVPEKCELHDRRRFEFAVIPHEAMARRKQLVLDAFLLPAPAFPYGCSFVRPAAAASLREVAERVKRHPDGKLVLWAHSDASGGESGNKRLSDRRARSLHAMIRKDVDAWVALCDEEKWGLKVVQEILEVLGFSPGPIDGVRGRRTVRAVRSFQDSKGLDVDGIAGPRTRRALFAAYLEKYAVDIPESAFAEPKRVGCGEFNLLHWTYRRNEPNRRAVAYVLRADRVPAFPCAADDTKPCRREISKGGDGSFGCCFYKRIAREGGVETPDRTPPPPPPAPPPPSAPPPDPEAMCCAEPEEENHGYAPKSREEIRRLKLLRQILQYEAKNGTWETIKRYNAMTGEIPDRNVWANLKDGTTADLCWMFDVALAAGGVTGTASELLGSIGGRFGEFVGAVVGQAVGSLAYIGGRFVGATVEGFDQGSWQSFYNYMKGIVEEDNLSGANMALRLAWGNAWGGEKLTIRELIDPEELQEIDQLPP